MTESVTQPIRVEITFQTVASVKPVERLQPPSIFKQGKDVTALFVSLCSFYLLAGDVLQVLARHDASEFGFNKALCPFSL